MNLELRCDVRGPALRGARCQCPTCGKVFASVRPFDRHRAGPMDGRRCLTDAEMVAAGFRLDCHGAYALAPRQAPARGFRKGGVHKVGKATPMGASP